MDFSVMDDSLFYKGGLYVYSHCLLNSDDTSDFLIIAGDKRSIYDSRKIADFIQENVPSESYLFTCPHYWNTYPQLHPLITDVVGNHLEKRIRRLFIEAHHSAKNAAKQRLESILNANP